MAVGILLERVSSHWGDQRMAMSRVQTSQELLLDELRAARQDKVRTDMIATVFLYGVMH